MRLSRKITVGAGIVIVLANAVVLQFTAWRHRAEMRKELIESARSYYDLIVLVRAWVAHNDGVYVRQRPGVQPNPYLERPVLLSSAGDTLVWRNPAMITRELSLLSEARSKGVRFRVTSLEPVNQANEPDEFEAAALRSYAASSPEAGGRAEVVRFEERDGARYLRFVAPLYTEDSCLSCHARQGYARGDLRGGISVSVPTETVRPSSALVLGGSLVIWAAASFAVFLLVQRMVVRPLRRLEDAAAEIGSGNFEVEILADSTDEIGDVGRALQRMQEALRDSVERQIEREKMFALGEMSAGIAHEIRNPLFALRNDLDYLQRSQCNGEVRAEVYREMEQGLQRIGNTVNSVLRYARPSSAERGRHELHRIVGECLALLRQQLTDCGVTVRLELEELPEIEVNAHQLEQVFVNLITNAVRARREEPLQIRIAAEVQGEEMVIVVADNGRGIAPEDRGRIFDPFFTRMPDGTGLGLTIVRRIIGEHQGSITVESEPGRGSTFLLRLPLRQTRDAT